MHYIVGFGRRCGTDRRRYQEGSTGEETETIAAKLGGKIPKRVVLSTKTTVGPLAPEYKTSQHRMEAERGGEHQP